MLFGIFASRIQSYLTDREVFDFTRLLGILDKAYLLVGKGNKRVWKPDVKGYFSVVLL
jgi:hypothetical protein